ncbi:MAG: OB-fold domain-containing protein [Porticoccaceae bacterium]|nr:OB-fold domain-containing protein [Pseudomonadales bacterium]MCP5172163.1 OB-fold domain-containing protein [Pseudomonadales bacterium]
MLEPLDAVWQKNLEEGILRLPRCENCKAWNWYPTPVCKCCRHDQFIWEPVSLNGTLFAASEMHRNFTGLEIGAVPYIVGLVEVSEAQGVRLPCRFRGEKANLPAIGESVTITCEYGLQGVYLGFL